LVKLIVRGNGKGNWHIIQWNWLNSLNYLPDASPNGDPAQSGQTVGLLICGSLDHRRDVGLYQAT
jgi:hypothetical protein